MIWHIAHTLYVRLLCMKVAVNERAKIENGCVHAKKPFDKWAP